MIGEVFGTNVFTSAVMARYLSEEQIQRLQPGEAITAETADAVARAMCSWAQEKGADHYCHWFQPLTGNTAEKHDSFLFACSEGKALLKLTGKQLMMGESDASSFPTGGLRGTAYARGYTAWDRSSPAFIKEAAAGPVLCIPTIFISYNGDALDTKTPLLRSMEAVDIQARRILALFGQTAGRVIPMVGAEQEYFLLDREKFRKRRDLLYCGRTLFGAPAPKGQELDDQYFGTIRQRQGRFMQELNRELWRLGVPASTQHNEVAPAQHELACLYAAANVAVDQNQLVMETMQRVAQRHGLACLLHEKPFAGINGSGKHNNWSLACENGENLLDPGPNPESNLRFQLILACILQAVDDHADLLRLSAANPGNDLRLGGQEAPPAIISVCLGDGLDETVHGLLAGNPGGRTRTAVLDPGISAVPAIHKDDTDRNRTSPFAFTGNKFEFRMVGASDSVAFANTVLNTIVAEAFCKTADLLEKAADFPSACRERIHQLLVEHEKILFRGDGYSDRWAREAARRGLPALPGMVDAISALLTEKSVEMFAAFQVFTRSELESRAEILYESYAKRLRIEGRAMLHMVSKQFIPAAVRFARELADGINALRHAVPGQEPEAQIRLLERVTAHLEEVFSLREALQGKLTAIGTLSDGKQIAREFYHSALPLMERLRGAVDELEMLVSKDLWPVPTYGDLLFEV